MRNALRCEEVIIEAFRDHELCRRADRRAGRRRVATLAILRRLLAGKGEALSAVVGLQIVQRRRLLEVEHVCPSYSLSSAAFNANNQWRN